MLRIVPHTVPGVGRSYEHFPDGFELYLLNFSRFLALSAPPVLTLPAAPHVRFPYPSALPRAPGGGVVGGGSRAGCGQDDFG